VAAVVEAARDGTLPSAVAALVPLANARRTEDRTLAVRTVKRWCADYKRDGWMGLAPASPRRNAPPPPWADALLAEYRRPTKPSLAAALERLPARLPDGVAMPSYTQAHRFLQSLPPVERERGRRGPNELLALQGFKRRGTDGLVPLAIATSDGHTLKALVQHPIHGRPFAPELCTVMDVVTRYVFGWSAGLAESRWVVMDAIRHGVSRLGMIGLLFTDNGSGFVNETLNDAEVQGLLARCGITHTTSIPGRAQSRGKIERLQGSLWKRAARDLVTYRGRDMDPEARKRVDKVLKRDMREAGSSKYLMSWTEFLRWAQDVVDDYNARPHSALPRIRDAESGKQRHMSPAEALAAWREDGWAPETLPAPVLEDLFRPYELRVVQRGEVKLPWGRYYDAALVAHSGQKVRVGYDIHDGERVWCREVESGRLICIAKRDGNVVPEQPRSLSEYAMANRAKRRLALLDQHRAEAEAELGPPTLDAEPDADDRLPLITSIPTALPRPGAPEAHPAAETGLAADDADDDEAMWDALGQIGAAVMAQRKYE
jgi:putative transposase